MRFDLFPFSPQLIQARWVWHPALCSGKEIEVDMREVTGIDDAGRELLVAMHVAGARLVAEGIVEAWISPYEGARFIWREIVNELWPNQQHPLLAFVGSASEYEDCNTYSGNPEETRRQIAQDIIEDARALLSSKL